MKIRPYMPAFCDFEREAAQEFDSFADAAKYMPILQRFAAGDEFDRFVWSPNASPTEDFLMALLKNGEAWVVAFVSPKSHEWRGDLLQWDKRRTPPKAS